MKLFSKYLNYFFTGIGFGAIAYLMILTFAEKGTAPTSMELWSIFLISGLIGLSTLIFELDIPFLIAILAHLAVTFILVAILILLNNWPITSWTLLIFAITYLLIWLVVLLGQGRLAEKIGSRFKKKKLDEE